MANPNPNTSGLVPLTSERAREIASEPRLPEPTKMASVRLFIRQLDEVKQRGASLTDVVRTLLDAWLAGYTPPQAMDHKRAWNEAVQAGVNARRKALGARGLDSLPPRPDGRPYRVKVLLRDGSAVYFQNRMTDVGSPSNESPDLIINGEDEAGNPRRVQGRASELMQLVFE